MASHSRRRSTQVTQRGTSRNEGKREQSAEPRVRKRRRLVTSPAEARADYFDGLPDDLLVSVLSKLSSSAQRPADLISALLTCKRFHALGHHPLVLSKAGSSCLSVRAKAWRDSAHRFLKRCVDCGNLEASYILGMIRFYALENRGSGASLMAKAAVGSHAAALYSLAIVQFNGSGDSKAHKDLGAGVSLCARAAFLGHGDALRELGHCLQDGYGVRRNTAAGRHLLVQVNAREVAAAVSSSWSEWLEKRRLAEPGGYSLLSDYGCSLPAPDPHPANRFLVEWFGGRGATASEELRLCSHRGCGRRETRRHEFRRCSVCGLVNYCSRACQALDWKLSHKVECAPTVPWAAASQ